METEQLWKAFVGDVSPAEFMRRHATDDSLAAARAHVADLPHFYGIALKASWAGAFNQSRQLTREEAVAALVEHLEATRNVWQDAVAEFAVPEEKRFALLQAGQVDAFLNERIVFTGAAPARFQNAEIDQIRPFKEMPLPKSSWVDLELAPKVLLNAPTDQEIETKLLQRRGGVSPDVIEKYASLAEEVDEGDDPGAGAGKHQ